MKIILRTGVGFGYGETVAFCEEQDIDYVLGLKSNFRLRVLSTPAQLWVALK